MSTTPTAHIAAHRFGLDEPSLAGIGGDAPGWLLAQIGPADPQRGDGLLSAQAGLIKYAEFLQAQRAQRAASSAMAGSTANATGEVAVVADPLRNLVQSDVRARLVTAATTARPFAERLALFWANHFTVSVTKPAVRGLAGAFEREAIRPNIAGNFETLLLAAVKHPAMLRYLDNEQSAGPNSRVVQQLQRRPRAEGEPGPRITGLNENLAREVLELHTLGVQGGGAAYGGWGGYTQADVTSFARVLTGWRMPMRAVMAGEIVAGESPTRFDPAWHEPGAKVVLGKTYGEGPKVLDEVLHDVAQHPSTANFIATKLARHFVADDPPPALVARLALRFRQTGGDLPSVYREIISAPEAWAAPASKLKTPEEFVISSARLLGLGEQAFVRQPDGGIGALGQRVHATPSPAGWPDRAEEWLGPDAVWKRVEWATRVADRVGRQTDARQLAQAGLGSSLSEATQRQIERAADGPQALALLLLSPEFQRR